eukprot:sb/3468406/
MLEKWQLSGTIGDYFLWRLCSGMKGSFISDQNAESWGFLDATTGDWDWEAVRALGIDKWLPKVVPGGTVISENRQCLHPELRVGKVFVPLGDLQASVYSVIGGNPGRVFNYGTACQLIKTVTPQFSQPSILNPAFRVCRYTRSLSLLTAASLNGGNALKPLQTQTGVPFSEILELAWLRRDTTLRCKPTFLEFSSYLAITQPFLDQFAKSWVHWKEDIEIFQMSLRKSKSAQIARLNGAKCAFSLLRRAICANFHLIELIL